MTDCLEWSGARSSGYGVRRIGGRKGHIVKVHRQTWEQANGPIPPGLWVLHHCDNPACYRIEHLFLGTHTDNMADMKAKGRGRKTVTRSKLTTEQVAEIRLAISTGEVQRRIAERYGVTNETICRINKGKTWNHVR